MQSGLPLQSSPVPTVVSPALYFVRHHRARRYLLRVEPNGRVRVTIPRGGSRREAEAFVVRQEPWIQRQLVHVTARESAFSDEQRTMFRARAATELPAELMAIASRHGMLPSRVSIRNQRSRWGSCGRNGHITLNWRLVAMPAWVREYVMVHELMHLHRLDHSPEYWRHVSAACPDHLRARAWLRVHGPSLL